MPKEVREGEGCDMEGGNSGGHGDGGSSGGDGGGD